MGTNLNILLIIILCVSEETVPQIEYDKHSDDHPNPTEIKILTFLFNNHIHYNVKVEKNVQNMSHGYRQSSPW